MHATKCVTVDQGFFVGPDGPLWRFSGSATATISKPESNYANFCTLKF